MVRPRYMSASLVALTAAALVATGSGEALAGPPGSSAPPSTGNAPGAAPAPTPAPAPAPAPVVTPGGPGVVPAPTYDAPPVYYGGAGDSPAPTYSGSYDPLPPVVHAPAPAKPVAPLIPRPRPHERYIYLSPTVKVAKGPLADADVRNINGQIGTGRARVATFYQSVGFPEDQAARTAASTTVGAVTGATAGALIVGIPTSIIGAGIGAGAGALIGGGISGGTLVGPGALIGAGVGAAAGAAAGGAVGAVGGGVIGGAVGTVIGAGDTGGDPNAPIGPTNESPRLSHPAPPHPEANQYELHAPGLNYEVNKRGDVHGSVGAGPSAVPISIPHRTADAPYQAAGALAQTARDSAAAVTAQASAAAQKALPGLSISYPQSTGKHAAPAGKHRK